MWFRRDRANKYHGKQTPRMYTIYPFTGARALLPFTFYPNPNPEFTFTPYAGKRDMGVKTHATRVKRRSAS